MINHFLDLLLLQICGVYGNFVVNWNGCCWCWIVVGNHVEIKDFVTILLNNCWINKSAWAWINQPISKLFKKSCSDSFVNENIKNLWIIIWSVTFDGFHKLTTWSFKLKAFLLERWASDSISVNNNLFWNLSFILIFPIIKRIPDKLNQNFRSSFAGVFFNFIFCHIFFTDQFLIQSLIFNITEMLGQVRAWGSR